MAERPTHEAEMAWLYDYELTLFGERKYILDNLKAGNYDFVSVDDDCHYN